MASMKIEISEDHELILSDVFSGIGIKTDQGRFGIAQRDGGIEIVKDGKIVWSSTSGPRLRPASISSERPFTPWVNVILRRADDAAALSEIPFVDSLLLLLGILDTAESPAGKVLEKVGCVLAVRTEASAMASTIANAFERQEQGTSKESAAPTADEILDVAEEALRVRKDEADETPGPEYVAKHKWNLNIDEIIGGAVFSCEKCGAIAREKDRTSPCPVAEAEHTVTKLANCLLAARGQISGDAVDCQSAYGWSPTYEAVKDLRAERDQLAEVVPATDDTKVKVINGLREALEQERGVSRTLGDTCQRFHDEKAKLKIEGDRLRMSLEHCRQATLANFDADALPTTGAEGVELHAFAAIRYLRYRYDDVRKVLKAEQAANADKVQIIDRQCRERRAIRTAAGAGDMDRLREILFPPESDDPESGEEAEIKTVVLDVGPDHLKVVEIENVTALRAERDYLTRILRMCERVAEGRKIPSTFLGTRSEALQAVMMLRAERDNLHKALKICELTARGWPPTDEEAYEGDRLAAFVAIEDLTNSHEALTGKLDLFRRAAEGLRSIVLCRVPCTCPPGEGNNPECPLLRVEKLFDDFRQKIGVIKAPQPNPPGAGHTAIQL